MLPTKGLEVLVYNANVASNTPHEININDGFMLVNVNVAYKNESITILCASGNSTILLTDSPYGLKASSSGGILTISTDTTGSYGLKIRILKLQ